MSILDLDQRLAALPPLQRQAFADLFWSEIRIGQLEVPEPLREAVSTWFGTQRDVRSQSIVRIVNRITGESTLFNPLRALRPQRSSVASVVRLVEASRTDCDFCQPRTRTTADSWGRIESRWSVSAANVAKYDADHGLIVFAEHDPHRFGVDEVADYVDCALAWIARTAAVDSTLRHPLIVWNCLDAAGASQVHGHAQAVIAREIPYGRDAQFRAALAAHAGIIAKHGGYFEWLCAVHRSLGLALERYGVTMLASLTPTKDRETMVIGGAAPDRAFAAGLTHVVRGLIDRLGVVCFNLSIHLPELGTAPGRDRRVVARVVDRGPLGRAGGGIGAMELYGTPVVAACPYEVIAALGSGD